MAFSICCWLENVDDDLCRPLGELPNGIRWPTPFNGLMRREYTYSALFGFTFGRLCYEISKANGRRVGTHVRPLSFPHRFRSELLALGVWWLTTVLSQRRLRPNQWTDTSPPTFCTFSTLSFSCLVCRNGMYTLESLRQSVTQPGLPATAAYKCY